jgi:hypothetical protein
VPPAPPPPPPARRCFCWGGGGAGGGGGGYEREAECRGVEGSASHIGGSGSVHTRNVGYSAAVAALATARAPKRSPALTLALGHRGRPETAHVHGTLLQRNHSPVGDGDWRTAWLQARGIGALEAAVPKYDRGTLAGGVACRPNRREGQRGILKLGPGAALHRDPGHPTPLEAAAHDMQRRGPGDVDGSRPEHAALADRGVACHDLDGGRGVEEGSEQRTFNPAPTTVGPRPQRKPGPGPPSIQHGSYTPAGRGFPFLACS